MVQKMNNSLESLHRLSGAIARASSLEAIYALILNEIVSVTDVERASIMRFDPHAQVLRIVAARGIDEEVWKNVELSVGEGVSGKVWEEGKPLLIKGMKPNPRYKTHSFLVAPVTAFPMKVGQTPIGLINLTDKKSGKPFTESDLKLIMTLADQMASYMHIHDLVDRLKTAEQAGLELEVAREIQQRLLPKAIPHLKGVEIEGCLIPATRVGADYYDYFGLGTRDLGPGTGICIADVSGHGVGGAMLAFAVRSCLRSAVNGSKNPAAILQNVNQMLFEDLLKSEQFVSLFYAHYFPQPGALVYSNAGHNPPLLWKAGQKEAQWLMTQDSLLGIEPDRPYKEKKCQLTPGDLLVLYTDGLTEAVGTNGKRFGPNNLLENVSASARQNAKTILGSLMENWKKFVGNQPVKDDVTVVVLKIL
ncbi:MAG: SpoIIE family protein phosphatase [Deltaproteobacteria bacterium]|nr:SpoIIE family protein phosphatase [Deltaproteobacteria bacterium]